MTLNNLAKLLIFLPVGACVTEDIGDEAVPAEFSDDVVSGGTVTTDALSPVRAVSTDKMPPGAPPVEPPVPPTPDGAPAPAADADMVFNGTTWFAVWTDRRNGHADVRGAMVGADGEVEPAGGILIVGGDGDQSHPRVAWNNGRYMVVYADDSAGYAAVRAAGVDAGGTVRTPGGFALGMPLELGHSPDVASNGTSFYAVWYGDCGAVACPGNVRGQFISSSGNVGPAVTLQYQAAAPAIAFDGNQYLCVWTDLAGGDYDLGARYIHADGSAAATTLAIARPGAQLFPSLAAGAGQFLLSWNEDGAVIAARMKDGAVIDQPTIMARNTIGSPALAGNDHGFALAWTQQLDGEVQVRGMAIDQHGKPYSAWISIRLPAADDARIDAKQPAIAFGGNGEAMVTWQDHADNGETTIWARPTINTDPFLVSALPE
jgi:hypothetical protein